MISSRSLIAPLVALSLTLAACGGDDDDADSTTPTEQTSSGDSSNGTDGDSSGSSTDKPGVSGTATFSTADLTIGGGITECSLTESEVSFVTQGENAQFEVSSNGGGNVGVVFSGAVEWEGSGTATISGSTVNITGSGSAQDDSAAVEDFTITADIESC
jgi:hypothetical protein